MEVKQLAAFVFLAAVITTQLGAAERLYFKQNNNLSWDNARSYCQACFKELVSVTPDNSAVLGNILTNDSWIGMRKKLGGPMGWSRWSDNTLLVFQNWYPQSPDPNNTEDTCVKLLSFGAWLEEDCNSLLPSICYEDRFYGMLNISNIRTRNLTLQWTAGPGNISYYRVTYLSNSLNVVALTYNIPNLLPGTLYEFKVYPVKCGRDLNAENASAYTQPEAVTQLSVTNISTTWALLTWKEPEGNCSHYQVNVSMNGSFVKTPLELKNLSTNITDLQPGTNYTFTVTALVEDRSIEGVNTSVCSTTYPAAVTTFSVSNFNSTSVEMNYTKPEGIINGYNISVSEYNSSTFVRNVLLSESSTNTSITNLNPGLSYLFSIATFSGNLSSLSKSIIKATTPSPPTNLSVIEWHSDSITVAWQAPINNISTNYNLSGNNLEVILPASTNNYTFKQLTSGTNYTISIYSCVFDPYNKSYIRGNAASINAHTRPNPPTNLKVTKWNTTCAILEWMKPANAENALNEFQVNYTNVYWNDLKNFTTHDTSVTLSSLYSGAIYTVYVRTKAQDEYSDPISINFTTEMNEKVVIFALRCTSSTLNGCDGKDAINAANSSLQSHFERQLPGLNFTLSSFN
ncbi:fibronectin-like [Polypterus senegalus]|uniref:fibronectin-like n=1 Tax=Polypterus senegalus TaxID=55291 RepID=UPI00196369A0|nr:fibronectin-like [Polypterus senegalus]